MEEKAMVLARRDPDGPYDPANCYWREPRSKREVQMGIEEWHPDEPMDLPFTAGERRQRKRMSDYERRMFDIWKRMMCRGGIFGEVRN